MVVPQSDLVSLYVKSRERYLQQLLHRRFFRYMNDRLMGKPNSDIRKCPNTQPYMGVHFGGADELHTEEVHFHPQVQTAVVAADCDHFSLDLRPSAIPKEGLRSDIKNSEGLSRPSLQQVPLLLVDKCVIAVLAHFSIEMSEKYTTHKGNGVPAELAVVEKKGVVNWPRGVISAVRVDVIGAVGRGNILHSKGKKSDASHSLIPPCSS